VGKSAEGVRPLRRLWGGILRVARGTRGGSSQGALLRFAYI